MTQSGNHVLLWTKNKAREVFCDEKMWLSFTGVKLEPEVPTKGIFPAILWSEQKRYLIKKIIDDEKESSKNIEQSKKRKFSEVGSTEEENTENKPKRRFTLTNIFNSIKSYVHQFTSLFKTEQNKTENPKPVLKTNVKINKPKTKKEYYMYKRHLKTKDKPIVDNVTLEKDSTPLLNWLKDEIGENKIRQELLREDTLQEKVFSDLHDRGYFVGPADVYGADYSIYKGGDPSTTHSIAAIRISEEPTVNGRDLLAFARVQNQVAKSATIAFEDDNKILSEKNLKYLVFNFDSVSHRI